MDPKTTGSISTFMEKVSDTLMPITRLLNSVRDFFRSIKRFSTNLWYYKGWLWNSHDFDYHYLLQIQVLYLQSLVNHNRRCAMGSEKSAKNIEKAIAMTQALIDDDFCKAEHAAHDAKWGTLELNFSPFEKDGLSTCIFSRKNAVTEEEKAQELKELRVIYKLEAKRMKATEKKLFAYLHKNYRSYWC